MSDAHNRLTSEVRSHQVRAEQAYVRPDAAAGPASEKRKRTSRFRMQRVSLLPFVPAPLIAYVERAHRRRRLRWLVLVGFVGAALLAMWPVARWAISSSDEPAAVSPPSLPVVAAAPAGASPKGPSLPRERGEQNGGRLATSAPSALPPAPAVVGPRRSRPVSTAARPSSSHEGSPKSTSRQPAAPASAWWW